MPPATLCRQQIIPGDMSWFPWGSWYSTRLKQTQEQVVHPPESELRARSHHLYNQTPQRTRAFIRAQATDVIWTIQKMFTTRAVQRSTTSRTRESRLTKKKNRLHQISVQFTENPASGFPDSQFIPVTFTKKDKLHLGFSRRSANSQLTSERKT